MAEENFNPKVVKAWKKEVKEAKKDIAEIFRKIFIDPRES